MAKTKKTKRYRPDRNTKVMMYFDLKRGVWIGDAETMRQAIRRGLTKSGLNSGRAFMNNLFVTAKEEVDQEKA